MAPSPAADREQTAPPSAAAATRLLALIKQVAAELQPDRPVHGVGLDSALDRDLGFDSLGRVELIVRLEQAFDVALPEQTFAEAATPRDLLRAVLAAAGAGPLAAPAEVAALTLGDTAELPYAAETLVEVLDWHVAAHPDRPHIQLYSDAGDGEVISFGALRAGAEQVARGLQQHELSPGESVVLMLPTGREYFLAFFGVLLAGGVPVPIYPPARPTQLEEHLRRHAGIVDNCLARILVTEPAVERAATLLRGQVARLRDVTTVAALSERIGPFVAAAPKADDVAFLQYTSGSTGDPKGVVLTHRNLLSNIRAMGEALQATPQDVCVSWLPLYHDMGLIGAWLGILHYAALLVIMSPMAFLARPQRWLWAIHRHRATITTAPNFGYELCVRRIADADIEGLDLGSLRVAGNGAEAVSPETLARFVERFAPYGLRREALMPLYGLAENSVAVTIPPLDRGPLIDRIQRERFQRTGRAEPAAPDEQHALAVVACGRSIPGHEIRIVDPAGRELPDRREGRLQFRGPSATSGYFRRPEQTRALFDDGWLESGDLAYTADGDVYVTGRSKDLIIRAGRNIYPAELEDAIGALDGVRKGNVAVFPSRDPTTPDAPERLVVLAETRARTAETQDRLRTAITGLTTDLVGVAPDDVVLAPPGSVLKTSSGKVRRAACRALYEAGAIGRERRALWWQVARITLASLPARARRGADWAAEWLYAGYGWALCGLFALPLWLAAMLPPRLAWRWAAVRGCLRLMAWAGATPFRVRGLENLPPAGRPAVFIANHSSYLDGFVLTAALPRPVRFVAKAELQDIAPVHWPLARVGAAFVERFDAQRGSTDARRLAAMLAEGQSPLFFAEGTFTRMAGLLPFHMGGFLAAAEAGVPVVPIAIRGTRTILRAESWFPRHGAITVTIGAPIDADTAGATADDDAWQTALKLRDAARAAVLRHTGEPDLGRERAAIFDQQP